MLITFRSIVVLTVTCVVASVLTACGGQAPAAVGASSLPCGAGQGPVVLAVSGRMGSPRPALTAPMQAVVEQAVRGGHPVLVVSLDGKPELVPTPAPVSVNVNSGALVGVVAAAVTGVAGVVSHVRANDPEVDDVAGLSLAAAAGRAAGPGTPTVILADSALQTTGALNYAQPGMVVASAADVTGFLASSGQEAQDKGAVVLLSGVGDTVAPQVGLTNAEKTQLRGTWSEIAKQGGASCVAVLDAPASNQGVTDVPPVSLVPVPAPPQLTPQVRAPIDLGQSQVAFNPDAATFVDPAAVQETLTPLATQLGADTRVRVTLTGATSSATGTGGPSSEDLSRQRAQAVADVLVSLGVGTDRITVVGAGSTFAGFVPDRSPDGVLLPGPAAQNRKVIVTFR